MKQKANLSDSSQQGEPQVDRLLDEHRPLHRLEPFPASADVVIIGGGIVGCSTAWFLAQRGISALICEKGRVACEQSGRNWGWVRQQGRAEQELPMMMRSNAIWRNWQHTLGEDTGFVQGGCLYLAHNNTELEAHAQWLTIAAAHGLETKILNQQQLAGVLHGSAIPQEASALPEAGQQWAGALYTPSDGRAEPGRAVPAIAASAMANGAQLAEHCAVRGVETQGGRVSAVVTEHGTVATSTVLCAAGAWTSLFAGSLGVTVPQLKLKGTVARTAPTVEVTNGNAWAPKIAIRRRNDGGYTVAHGAALEHAIVPATLRFGLRFLPALRQEHGAARVRLNGDFLREGLQRKRWALHQPTVFEKQRILHPQPSTAILREMRDALGECFPELAEVPFVETWAGMIESSPDLLPMIGPVEALPGLMLATGFSGHGFGLGPGAGECIAKMITGEAMDVDMHAFRHSRFFDGSPIALGPTL